MHALRWGSFLNRMSVFNHNYLGPVEIGGCLYPNSKNQDS